MHSESNPIQFTFFYTNGDKESFNVYDPAEADMIQQDLQQEMRRILDRQWWILHLAEQTVFINTANVLKVEIKPTISRVQGEGVFPNAARVTTLSRAHS